VALILTAIVGGPHVAGAARAYVTNLKDGSISVIDTGSNTVVDTINFALGGVYPLGVAVNASATRVWVTHLGSNQVSVIDTASDFSASGYISVGRAPWGVAVNPAGTRAWVANSEDNTVSVIDGGSYAVIHTIAVGKDPAGVAVSPSGTRVFVTNRGDNTVSVIDAAASSVVGTIPVGNGPAGVVVDPTGISVYVTNQFGNSVSVIDAAGGAVVATIPVGAFPRGIATNPSGSRVWVANYNGNSVSVIDTATNTVVGAPIPAGGGPIGISLDPTGSRAYVANNTGNSVSVIDTATLAVVGAPIPVGGAFGQPYAFGQFIMPAAAVAPPVPTTTSVSSSANPALVGQTVTFTATVAPVSGSAKPTGTVVFRADGLVLGAPVALSNGTAGTTTASLATGTHVVTVAYGGAAGFGRSVGTLAGGQVVKQPTPPPVFPGVASMSGQNDTQWRSEVVLFNAGTVSRTATLEIIPRGGTAVAASGQHTLQPGATARIPDLYADLHAPSGAGMLRVTGDLLTWVRTFNLGASGTFGQDVPAVIAGDPTTAVSSAIFPIATPADVKMDFRSNLLLVNLENTKTTFRLATVGGVTSYDVQASTYAQINDIRSLLHAAAGTGVLAVSAAGRWSGTVSTIDPVLGDPTTVRGLSPAPLQVALFPGIASSPGQNNTQWRSEAVLVNPWEDERSFLLEIIPRGTSTVAASTSVRMASGQVRRIADLYAELHAQTGAGMLRVTGGALAWVRTFNLGATATFGQDVPVVDPSAGTAAGTEVLFPIASPADIDTQPRSNFLVFNHETAKTTCTLTAGTASKTLDVPAGAYVQISNVGTWFGVPAGYATVTVRANGRWSGTVSTIDPFTGDPTTVIGIAK